MSDSSSSSKKKGWPRGRKRNIKVKDVNAPKMPMSGYMLFLNDHRERVRAANPGATFSDMTRLLANAWQAAPPDEKQRYMEAAQHDRERYNQELQKYQQTDAYREFNQLVKNKNTKRPVPIRPPPPPPQSLHQPVKTSAAAPPVLLPQQPPQQMCGDSGGAESVSAGPLLVPCAVNQPAVVEHNAEPAKMNVSAAPVVAPLAEDNAVQYSANPEKDGFAFDLPIFSAEFLSYNQDRETELRQLRRVIDDQEERNAALQKHIDGVQEAVESLEKESSEQRGQNTALQQHLGQLRAALAHQFGQISECLEPSLPTPTAHNIDEFLNRLYVSLGGDEETGGGSQTAPDAKLVAAVRAVMVNLNLH